VFTPPPKENAHEPVDTLTEDEPIVVVKEQDDDDRKVNADVNVLVPAARLRSCRTGSSTGRISPPSNPAGSARRRPENPR
jgi:hypothetical protein